MRTSSRLALVALICLAVPAAALNAGDAMKPVTTTPDQMKWAANPDSPGVMTAVAWGDPATGPHGAFHKFTAGFTSPLHTHSANLRAIVISGTMSMTGEDGREMKLPAGSYFYQPTTFRHVTKCLAGSDCLVFVDADGKWDLKPVAGK